MKADIVTWDEEEANKKFELIEANKGKGEWIDIDWKEKLNFEDTSLSNQNTTHRTVSGFANTYGGQIVIGFAHDGSSVGVKSSKDIENHIQNKLENKLSEVPLFKVGHYRYKEKEILVIFVGKSKKPIQCDNGIYYYRSQSEFRSMPYEMLEKVFKENFEEEKYLYLVRNDLLSLKSILENNGRFAKFGHSVENFLSSEEKLYNYYETNNLNYKYTELRLLIDLYISQEAFRQRYDAHEKKYLIEKIDTFLKALDDVYGRRN